MKRLFIRRHFGTPTFSKSAFISQYMKEGIGNFDVFINKKELSHRQVKNLSLKLGYNSMADFFNSVMKPRTEFVHARIINGKLVNILKNNSAAYDAYSRKGYKTCFIKL